VETFKVDNHQMQLRRGPDTCPVCQHGVDAKKLTENIVGHYPNEDFILEVVYACPRDACQRAFIVHLDVDLPAKPTNVSMLEHRARTNPVQLKMIGQFPINQGDPELPQEVTEASPGFRSIFTQAIRAERAGLDQIVAIGLRKALETLIKDYCAKVDSAAEDAIRSGSLEHCVTEYVSDENLKACAGQMAWLESSDLEYVRTWQDKDIEDLKTLVEMTIAWVRSGVLRDKFLTGREPKARPAAAKDNKGGVRAVSGLRAAPDFPAPRQSKA
jgi:hypothetical protein